MIQRFFAGSALILAAALGVSLASAALDAAPGQSTAAPHNHTGAAASAPQAVTPMKAHTGPLPPLPRVAYQPARPMAVMQLVYEFAAQHPEVLQYIPCYCGCERKPFGHTANHDCFVKARAANGRVTQWDEHGMGCAICVDVARDAMTMFMGGARAPAIRAAIDKKYGTYFPSSTPTPKPAR